MKEYKVTLAGLNKRQVNILDTMWSLNTPEEWDDWYDTLDKDTAHEALVLRQMIILEIHDQEATKDLSLAKGILEKILK